MPSEPDPTFAHRETARQPGYFAAAARLTGFVRGFFSQPHTSTVPTSVLHPHLHAQHWLLSLASSRVTASLVYARVIYAPNYTHITSSSLLHSLTRQIYEAATTPLGENKVKRHKVNISVATPALKN